MLSHCGWGRTLFPRMKTFADCCIGQWGWRFVRYFIALSSQHCQRCATYIWVILSGKCEKETEKERTLILHLTLTFICFNAPYLFNQKQVKLMISLLLLFWLFALLKIPSELKWEEKNKLTRLSARINCINLTQISLHLWYLDYELNEKQKIVN